MNVRIIVFYGANPSQYHIIQGTVQVMPRKGETIQIEGEYYEVKAIVHTIDNKEPSLLCRSTFSPYEE